MSVNVKAYVYINVHLEPNEPMERRMVAREVCRNDSGTDV